MWTLKSGPKRKYLFFLSLIVFGLILSSTSLNLSEAALRYKFPDKKFNMIIKTNGGGVRPDICLYVAQYLRDIGIDVQVKVEEWTQFLGTLCITTDFDMGFLSFEGEKGSPDLRNIYSVNGGQNFFGLDYDIPYVNQSEEMLDQGVVTLDLEERQQLYYEWQNLIMDKIIPIFPFFSARNYIATWANTENYHERWGLSNSLPYMNYVGFHTGQVDLTEFNLADNNWKSLNPLISIDSTSSLVQSLLMEPIVQMNPDFAPIKTGLVYDWEIIDENHYKFYMLDEVFWNPSYDSWSRDSNSVPLPSIPDGELLTGLKTGEYSNGTNQQVKAKDAVFTYLASANSAVSESTVNYEWISDIYVDPLDDLSFHVHMDGDPDTPDIETFADMWTRLPINCLPEFFLNSSNPTVTFTAGGVECTGLYPAIVDTPQWIAYYASAFGCGKYSLDYAIKNSVTVLKRSPCWFGIGALDGATGLTPFVETVNIRVIPDLTAALSEFKAGKLDFVDLTNNYPTDRKVMQADSKYTVLSFMGNSISCIAFNLRRPHIGGVSNEQFLIAEGKEEYTKAIALRKAICYAIDRNEINDVLYDGERMICNSPMSPSAAYYYYNDILKYDHDLTKAKEWFDAAFPIPIIDITIENHQKVGKSITIIADYTPGPQVTNSAISYSVNETDPVYSTMLEEKDDYYTYNIGSNLPENITVDFNLTARNVYYDSFTTSDLSFRVGIKDDKFLVSYPCISLLFLVVIPIYYRSRRMKK